jgi:hypothetical protein
MATKSNASAIDPNATAPNAIDPNAAATGSQNADTASSATVNTPPRPSGIAPAGSTVSASSKSAPPLPYRPFDFREAHALTAAKRASLLPEAIVRPIGFDVPYASKVALGAAARLEPHREKIAERFSDELAEVDMIDTYARSVNHAYVLFTTTTAPPEKVQAVYEAGLTARRFLSSDLNNLVTLGLLAPKQLAEVSGEAGHLNVANDIQKLVSIAERSGEAIASRMALPASQRNEYLMLSYELMELAARRDSGGPTTEEARDDLDRAITLLVNAYDVAERVATYTLWKNEAYREVVPSLYNRPKSRKGSAAPEEPAPIAATLDTPEDTVVSEEPIAPGARGGSPFAK